jgi:putative endonuclease
LIWRISDFLRQGKQRRTLTPEAAVGRRGEDVAHRYLQRAGLKVVARNYRPGPDSEIDIVARDGETVVFVEVKSRGSAEFGSPERAIDEEKRRHILRAAQSYMTRAGIEWSQVRFDVISIIFSEPPFIHHERDTFFEGRAI